MRQKGFDSNDVEHVKTITLGHLDIEVQQIRLGSLDSLQPFQPVAAHGLC